MRRLGRFMLVATAAATEDEAYLFLTAPLKTVFRGWLLNSPMSARMTFCNNNDRRHMEQMPKPEIRMDRMLEKLRARATMLRIQAYFGIAFIAVIAVTLIVFLASRTYPQNQISDEILRQARPPFSVKLLEDRHVALAEKIDLLVEASEQRFDLDEADKKQATQALVQRWQVAIGDLRDIKKDLVGRLAKDRENLQLELNQMRNERDAAIRAKIENGLLWKMIGESAFRVAAILLSVYFISILANISKYLLRVADHLNAVADSIDALALSGLSVEKGISALTPHPIDFHIDETFSLRSLRDIGFTFQGPQAMKPANG